MRIIIDVGHCRNEECGDWYEDHEGTVHIKTVKMPVESQVAVAIHELIEYLRCKQDGVTDMQVTQFDAQFLRERLTGMHPEDAEAGNDKRAPYFKQHQDSTFIERCVCAVLNCPWNEHEKNMAESLQ